MAPFLIIKKEWHHSKNKSHHSKNKMTPFSPLKIEITPLSLLKLEMTPFLLIKIKITPQILLFPLFLRKKFPSKFGTSNPYISPPISGQTGQDTAPFHSSHLITPLYSILCQGLKKHSSAERQPATIFPLNSNLGVCFCLSFYTTILSSLLSLLSFVPPSGRLFLCLSYSSTSQDYSNSTLLYPSPFKP